jgi:hypothetical protein
MRPTSFDLSTHATDAGKSYLMRSLGNQCFNGDGVKKSAAKLVWLCTRAIEAVVTFAMRSVCDCHFDGGGMNTSIAIAIQLFVMPIPSAIMAIDTKKAGEL